MTIREMIDVYFLDKGFDTDMSNHIIEQTKSDFAHKINRYPFTIDTSQVDLQYWQEIMELLMLIGITIQKFHYSVFI